MKVAVIGFGFMGMTHAANILKNKGLTLRAIVDTDVVGIERKLHSKTGNFAIDGITPGQLKNVGRYSDLQSCLQQEDLDAVHVCVHTNLHYAIAREALSAGLHVLLEKPMTLDVKEGQELINLSIKQNKTLMVGHVVRFMAPYLKLKKWFDESTYGKLRFLSLSRFSGVPAWGQWKEKQQAFGSSGGALFDLLIHDIDFAHFLLGKPGTIESTSLPGLLSNHDYVSAFWHFPQQKRLVRIEGGNTFHSSFPFQAGYMANFDHASVLYTTLKPDIIQVATDENILHIRAEEDTDGFYNEIDYFYQCIEKGVSPEACTPQSALETIEICYQHINQ